MRKVPVIDCKVISRSTDFTETTPLGLFEVHVKNINHGGKTLK